MRTRTVFFILAIVLSFGLPFVTMQKAMSAEKILIRIGSPFKAGHILCDAAEKFKDLVEKGSAGGMEVQTQFGAASEEDINDWCSQGKIEMQSNGHRAIEIFAPQYFFFNAPYVIKDFDHFMRVWEGGMGKKAREQMEKNGKVMYLGIVYRGLRQTTSKKPLYTPADVAGLKIRLPVIKTWIAVWNELGAESVPIPLPELYRSLKEGKANASEGDITQISSFQLDEVQTHVTMTNHLVQTGGVAINKAFFDKLSKGNQDLIVQAGKQASNWATEKLKSGETKLLVDLQRKGMQVVIPDAEAFREKGKPAVEALFQKEWPVTTWKEVLAQ